MFVFFDRIAKDAETTEIHSLYKLKSYEKGVHIPNPFSAYSVSSVLSVIQTSDYSTNWKVCATKRNVVLSESIRG